MCGVWSRVVLLSLIFWCFFFWGFVRCFVAWGVEFFVFSSLLLSFIKRSLLKPFLVPANQLPIRLPFPPDFSLYFPNLATSSLPLLRPFPPFPLVGASPPHISPFLLATSPCPRSVMHLCRFPVSPQFYFSRTYTPPYCIPLISGVPRGEPGFFFLTRPFTSCFFLCIPRSD